MIRVIGIFIMFLLMATAGGAVAEPVKNYSGDPGQISGIYCYDYFLLGNKKLDTNLFFGTNPNASFMEKDDIQDFKRSDECTTYVVTEEANVNLFDPFFGESKKVDYSTDSSKILPNPRIMFIDEENIDFKKFSSGDTVLYGGVLPFVALPDGDLETEDSFFNEESFSLFLYFKTKF